jgi:16S rRNA C967 or C1407 C5-methylase (RsmB/RsmF family)/NOL1/NOP2/fmu family ribosome biogenesis protein
MTDPQHFPEEFRARMAELLGPQETAELLRALSEPAVGLRVNSLRLTPERFLEIAPFQLEPLPFPEEGFRVTGGPRPGRHPFHDAGLYYLQDPGAMAVGALVDPRPGERVLDLAAAPGGKATHLAARMRGRGLLVANDVSPARARELAGNLERCGVRNALVLTEPADRLAERFSGWFDRVLLDAPCSGESMFPKSEAARSDWSPAAVLGCARRQGDLILEAARMVRPGGLLVYSTCTFSPEENEGVVAALLTARPDFELAELPPIPGADAARADWLGPVDGPAPDLSRALRLWPQRVPGAGHFVAAFRRIGGEPSREPDPQRPSLSRESREWFGAFAADSLVEKVPEERIHDWRSELYLLPPETPELEGLRVVRPGWWLGTPAKRRFEPSHALALGLDAAGARRVVELDPDSPEAAAFLHGETLSRPGEAGWALVAVEGFALGWGKRVGSTVKNHFPKGLRWRG